MEVDNFSIQYDNLRFFIELIFASYSPEEVRAGKEKVFQRRLELIKYSVYSRISQALISN